MKRDTAVYVEKAIAEIVHLTTEGRLTVYNVISLQVISQQKTAISLWKII